MISEIQDLQEHLERFRAVTLQVLDIVNDDELQWRPDENSFVYRWGLPASERPIRGAQVMKLQRDRDQWWKSMLGDFEGLRELLASQP